VPGLYKSPCIKQALFPSLKIYGISDFKNGLPGSRTG